MHCSCNELCCMAVTAIIKRRHGAVWGQDGAGAYQQAHFSILANSQGSSFVEPSQRHG